MSGAHFFRQHIQVHEQGIEIAPWFNPIAPKALGYNCLSLDIWDRETLVERAKNSPQIPPASIPLIEEVDLIGTASALGDLAADRGLAGAVDYVVGSHVIEHIPDLVRFFQSVEHMLRPGGSLLLAVPDCRACFDYFRPHSTTADVLVAYAEKRLRPTLQQILNQHSLEAAHGDAIAFSLDAPADEIRTGKALKTAYTTFRQMHANPPAEYVDSHCWVFVPASFELIVRELAHLDLVHLDVDFITETFGCEFYVKLRNNAPRQLSEDVFHQTRDRLLHTIHVQLASRWADKDGAVMQKLAELSDRLAEPDAIDLIRKSDFFDEEYYRRKYPDVVAAGVDPVLHYVRFGWKEGRNPHANFNTLYYLGANPEVARSGINPLLHYLRKGAAENRPAKAHGEAQGDVLSFYAQGAPSAQQTVDIFAGEWLSAVPGVSAGSHNLFDDDRVKWGCGTLGGVRDQRVLELGPLEGAHTYGLIRQMGARSVVAVEANSEAFLKCLVTKELHGLTEANYLFGDCIAYLEGNTERFDLIFASGILYHMREPLRLLSAIAARTDRLVLSTHYYDQDMIEQDPAVRVRFSPAPPTGFAGLSCPAWRYDYGAALDSALFCGGNAAYSYWIEKASILEALRKLGFAHLQQNHDRMTPAGPIFTLAAARS